MPESKYTLLCVTAVLCLTGAIAVSDRFGGSGTPQYGVADVECRGTESRLSDCSRQLSIMNPETCAVAAVVCQGEREMA